jgi:hypothetical protein
MSSGALVASAAGGGASSAAAGAAGAGVSSGLSANTGGAGTSPERAKTTEEWLAIRNAANRPKPNVISAIEATTEAAMTRKFGSMPGSP